MDLTTLQSRKSELEASLKQIEQSYHIVTGQIGEVNYQISLLPKEDNSSQCEESPVTMD